MSNSDTTVRFGLVGFGAWGQFHAKCIAGADGAELAAIAVRSAESQAKAKAAYPNAVVVGDYQELVALELDIVDVVLPSHIHFEVASAVLDAGKHLLLEKPMCLNIADCRALVEKAESGGQLLSIMHELRLSSMWGEMKRLIESGEIGEPQYLMMELSRHPYRTGSGGWRYNIDQVGSWILEEPIHFFDLARWYFGGVGDPVRVFATAMARDPERPELQDNFTATMHFPNEGFAVICQTLCAFEHHQSMKISGTNGALWARWSGAQDRTEHPEFSLKVFDGETVRDATPEKITGEIFELQDHMAMLVAAVRDGGPLTSTGVDGMWSVAMCLAAEASIKSGVSEAIEL